MTPTFSVHKSVELVFHEPGEAQDFCSVHPDESAPLAASDILGSAGLSSELQDQPCQALNILSVSGRIRASSVTQSPQFLQML